MLKKKIVRFKKIYKFYIKHFLVRIIVILINRNLYGNTSAKREYRDENVFLKVDRVSSKLIKPFL